MLRAALVLLVLANGLFLAWTQSWLAPVWPPPGDAGREPQRLAMQVNPQEIRVLSPVAASDAAAAASLAATGESTRISCGLTCIASRCGSRPASPGGGQTGASQLCVQARNSPLASTSKTRAARNIRQAAQVRER